ncbi:MAG: bifunctional metallophosphatase/5'-nucleotidase [Deltaproteobacteria bacterium]|nr:bifunctional metallophosphatase/5'-nucleotidase [Deltaproteobacteria bacterium]
MHATPTQNSFFKNRRQALKKAAVFAPMLMLPSRGFANTHQTVTLLHTNDTHSRMEPFTGGPFKGRAGVARRMTLIERVRKESPISYLFDAGDTFQGTPWFNAFKGSVDIQVMKALGYDATAIGNHDFDAGADTLSENLKLYPQLCAVAANFTIGAQSELAGRVLPNAIFEKAALTGAKGPKVGVFGLGVKFDGLVHPKLHPHIGWRDPIEVANEQVSLLREQGCKVIVALSHLGYKGYSGERGDTAWPTQVKGVHYVVGGHSHTFLKKPKIVRHRSGWETHVMQVGHSGLNLGRADLRIDPAGRIAFQKIRPLGIGGKAIV